MSTLVYMNTTMYTVAALETSLYVDNTLVILLFLPSLISQFLHVYLIRWHSAVDYA